MKHCRFQREGSSPIELSNEGVASACDRKGVLGTPHRLVVVRWEADAPVVKGQVAPEGLALLRYLELVFW